MAYTYYCGNKKISVSLNNLKKIINRKRSSSRVANAARGASRSIGTTLRAQHSRLSTRFHSMSNNEILMDSKAQSSAHIIATESLILDGARQSEIKFARDKFGFEEVQEGRHGKVLLMAPGDDGDRVAMTFKAAEAIYKRGKVKGSHPNFLRALRRPAPSNSTGVRDQWGIDNPGTPGIPGADVHGFAAWTITEGVRNIRVAVLDEGVDTLHPHLKDIVVAEADFVDDNGHAIPDGDDAHGTACAGIIAGQSSNARGLAPGVSLVGVRIAKSNANGDWIFDDFDTADAIDWSWDEARSDVLSNSWGGGPPVDVMTSAFARARTQGRGGKGAVIIAAAGNNQGPVSYPGTLEWICTVGASNQWDKRKTRTSADGENWGSNFGDSLDLLAPGVRIKATDIRGTRGYASGLITDTFNGTSSATPHVAATAALILSIRPDLTESKVREILNATADPLRSGGWNNLDGHGRLNAFNALRMARRV